MNEAVRMAIAPIPHGFTIYGPLMMSADYDLGRFAATTQDIYSRSKRCTGIRTFADPYARSSVDLDCRWIKFVEVDTIDTSRFCN